MNNLLIQQIFDGIEIYCQNMPNSKPDRVYSSIAARAGWELKVLQPDLCIKDSERCYQGDDVCIVVDYKNDDWFWDMIKYLATIRIFEIWGDKNLTAKIIYRGLGIASEKIRQSKIAGILSVLLQKEILTKTENGVFRYSGNLPTAKEYSKVRPLGSNQKSECRKVALLQK